MSAIDDIRAALSNPHTERMSRSEWHPSVSILADGYPLLAAALAEFLAENDMPIPGPLRHARNNVNQQRRGRL